MGKKVTFKLDSKLENLLSEKLPQSPLKLKYETEVKKKMMEKFGYKNVMQVPKIVAIAVNRGIGEANENPAALEKTIQEFILITRQKPAVARAKKSIASFRVREGAPIGVRVTLRGNRMYTFFEKLINTALPRIRDFKGLSPNSFDGRGNYTFGIKEQLIFPEIEYDMVDKVRGFDVTIITTAKTDEEAKALLEFMGFPFRKN
ncbi:MULTISPECIES: 50S ribosomal protein L5 [Caldisericum]|jgi:large subunit ribosomal protein L5|uniref:Large ribosomal subunit protein uL5 n=1 Tax=Caldisericum exile TaxID=693075 RepID=A0A2J6WDP7_9BACT|nr:MAG: 50S ribosomal protein L5 [Caldisericum exile]